MKQHRPTARPTGWQALVALAVGATFAGMPSPALPLSADDAGTPTLIDREDAGGADTLAIETLRRISESRRLTSPTRS